MVDDPVVVVEGVKPPDDEMKGPGTALTVKAARFDTMLDGFRTLTNADPGTVIRFAGTSAVNCVELTKAVVNGTVAPPAIHCTIEAATKFVPFTLNWKEPLPETALEGLNPSVVLMVGDAAALIVNSDRFELVPPGFWTAIK